MLRSAAKNGQKQNGAPQRPVSFEPQENCLGSSRHLAGQLFLDTSRLARTIAHVVQLGPTNVTPTLDFDRSNQRGVGLESTLDAFAGRNLAHGEAGVQTTVTLGDDDAFVSLQTLAVTFRSEEHT